MSLTVDLAEIGRQIHDRFEGRPREWMAAVWGTGCALCIIGAAACSSDVTRFGAHEPLDGCGDDGKGEAARSNESTASVEDETAAFVQGPRCGVADEVNVAGTTDKFAFAGGKMASGTNAGCFDAGCFWPSPTVTWRLLPTSFPLSNGITQAQAAAQIAEAFSTWADASGLEFSGPTAELADIDIEFLNADEQGDNPLRTAFGDARQPGPGLGGDVRLHTGRPTAASCRTYIDWSIDDTLAAGAIDLQSVILHELGHAIGLKHSSIGNNDFIADASDSVMASNTGMKRDLHVDDEVAASVLYERWTPMGGSAQDIGIGADGSDADAEPDVWVVSTTPVSGNGFEVEKWTGSTPLDPTYSSHATGGQGAVCIAVGPSGRPWIINGSGRIFERTNTDPGAGRWAPRGGEGTCATDIGVGGRGDDVVWALGCSVKADGGFAIFRWNGSAWHEPNPGSTGKKIAVDGLGVPWVVAGDGALWRRPAALEAWQPLPANAALDIGAGPVATAEVGGVVTLISYVYLTTPDASIRAWNEQPANPYGDDPPVRFGDVPTFDGSASRIAVGPDGVPWVLAIDGSIFRQL